MFECIIGILLGFLVGRWIDPGFGPKDGLIVLIVFLALIEELTAMVFDKRRWPLVGLVLKALFVLLVLGMERITGAPLAPFVVLILLGSFFARLGMQLRSGSDASFRGIV